MPLCLPVLCLCLCLFRCQCQCQCVCQYLCQYLCQCVCQCLCQCVCQCLCLCVVIPKLRSFTKYVIERMLKDLHYANPSMKVPLASLLRCSAIPHMLLHAPFLNS